MLICSLQSRCRHVMHALSKNIQEEYADCVMIIHIIIMDAASEAEDRSKVQETGLGQASTWQSKSTLVRHMTGMSSC